MTWNEFFKAEKSKEYYQRLEDKLIMERKEYTIFPKEEDLFKAFELCPLEELKIIIFGQDPYHGDGEAMGLAFAVRSGVKLPPSLKNIYKELNHELGIPIPRTGDLSPWARQGMLLINRTLTVRKDTPNSHKKIGWENFIINLIEFLNSQNQTYCYCLLGNDAKELKKYISKKDYIIEGVHPSPLSASRGFFNSDIFKKISKFTKDYYDYDFDFRLEDTLL